MKPAYICSSFFHYFYKLGRGLCQRLVYLSLRHLQRSKLRFVELFAVFKKGSVSPLSYVCNDLGDDRLDIYSGHCPCKNVGICDLSVFQDPNHTDSSTCFAIPETILSMASPLNL